MSFTGIHHPAFVTGDLERTVRFWRDLLGMRLVYTLGEAGNRQAFFAVTPDTFIAFFEWPDVQGIAYRRHGTPRGGNVVFDHVAIKVAAEEDLWDIMGRLEAAGMPISDAVDHGHLRSIYTYDPNGIPLEFTWPVQGCDISARPLFMDNPQLPITREGPDPVPGHWPDAEEIPGDERLVVPGEGHDHFTTKGKK